MNLSPFISILSRRMTFGFWIISFFVLLIFGIKYLLKSRLSLKAQYHLWFPLLIALMAPFIPSGFGNPGNISSIFFLLKNSAVREIQAGFSHSSNISAPPDIPALQDFSLSLTREGGTELYTVFFWVWILGIIFMGTITLYSVLKINLLKQASLPLENKKLLRVYNSCQKELHIKRNIPVFTTAFLKTPVTAGFIKPYIILPLSAVTQMSEKEIRYIFLHELTHCKHMDPFINYVACLAQIVYWFHPGVWLALKSMRRDCESACDGAVLSHLNQQDYISYGSALLHYVAEISGLPYSPASGMGAPVNQLKKRILIIKNYTRESREKHKRSVAVLIAVTVLIVSFSPVISSNASSSNHYQFTDENIIAEDYSSFFNHYTGSFVVYDSNADKYHIYNQNLAGLRVSPNSTYKIYSALAALESHVITPDSHSRLWNGTNYPFKAWNQDQTLSSAMKNSVNWYFTSLDEENGLISLQKSLSRINYGNQDLSGGIGQYWLESNLKISPMEQVQLLTKLQNQTLPFNQENIEAVKCSLLLSSNDSFSLYGKTGTGIVNEKIVNSWFIGFLETKDNVYVFAANLQGENAGDSLEAGQITLNILENCFLSQDLETAL